MEEDEAGRLRSFRARFGRGFDAEALKEGEEVSVACFGRENVEVLTMAIGTGRRGEAG